MLVTELWIIIDFILTVAWWVIVVQAVLSWLIGFNVINTSNDAVRGIWSALERITEPVYRPIRRILPDFGALDFSAIVVLLLIGLLQRLVHVQMVQSAAAAYGV